MLLSGLFRNIDLPLDLGHQWIFQHSIWIKSNRNQPFPGPSGPRNKDIILCIYSFMYIFVHDLYISRDQNDTDMGKKEQPVEKLWKIFIQSDTSETCDKMRSQLITLTALISRSKSSLYYCLYFLATYFSEREWCSKQMILFWKVQVGVPRCAMHGGIHIHQTKGYIQPEIIGCHLYS